MTQYQIEPDVGIRRLSLREVGTNKVTYIAPALWGDIMRHIGLDYTYRQIVSKEHLNLLGKTVDHVTKGRLTRTSILQHLQHMPPEMLCISDPENRLFKDVFEAHRTRQTQDNQPVAGAELEDEAPGF